MDDCWRYILSYLSIPDKESIRTLSRYFYRIVSPECPYWEKKAAEILVKDGIIIHSCNIDRLISKLIKGRRALVVCKNIYLAMKWEGTSYRLLDKVTDMYDIVIFMECNVLFNYENKSYRMAKNIMAKRIILTYMGPYNIIALWYFLREEFSLISIGIHDTEPKTEIIQLPDIPFLSVLERGEYDKIIKLNKPTAIICSRETRRYIMRYYIPSDVVYLRGRYILLFNGTCVTKIECAIYPNEESYVNISYITDSSRLREYRFLRPKKSNDPDGQLSRFHYLPIWGPPPGT